MAKNALLPYLDLLRDPGERFAEKFAKPFPEYFPPFAKDIYFAILSRMFHSLSHEYPDFDFDSLRTEIDYCKKWFQGKVDGTKNEISQGDWWEREAPLIYVLARCEYAASMPMKECNKWIAGKTGESGASFIAHLKNRPDVKAREKFKELYIPHLSQIFCVEDLDKFPALKAFRVDPITGDIPVQDDTLHKWMKQVLGNRIRGRGRPLGKKNKIARTAGKGDSGMMKGA